VHNTVKIYHYRQSTRATTAQPEPAITGSPQTDPRPPGGSTTNVVLQSQVLQRLHTSITNWSSTIQTNYLFHSGLSS